MEISKLEQTMGSVNWVTQLLSQAELNLIHIIKNSDLGSAYSLAELKFCLDLVRLANGYSADVAHDVSVKFEQVVLQSWEEPF